MRAATRTIKPLLAAAAVALCAALTVAAPAAAAEPACPNEQVRSESNIDPATGKPYDLGLPECRAYEMVSPLEKQGDGAALMIMRNPVAADGSTVGFDAGDGFSEPTNFNAANGNGYLTARGAGGWGTPIFAEPPSSLIPLDPTTDALPGVALSTPDLSEIASCGNTGQSAGLTAPAVVCALRLPDGAWIETPAYPTVGGTAINVEIEGASSDLSHIVFRDQANAEGAGLLTSDGNGGGTYEVEGLGGPAPQLRLVNVNNNGEELGEGDPGLGEGGAAERLERYHAVSSDGQTIFFSAQQSYVKTLYARLDHRETIDISNPTPSQCTRSCGAPANAYFQGAAANGERVYFLTAQQMVNADTDHTTDLYEYNFGAPAGHRIVQVSGGAAGDPSPGAGAEAQGVVRVSSDGSHVYFVARGLLTSVPNALGQSAVAGGDNLYGFNAETGETKFVAELCSNASTSGTVSDAACPATLNGGAPGSEPPAVNDQSLWGLDEPVTADPGRQAQVTPNGRYLVFTTYARLAGKDTDHAQDVYRYDFQTGEVTLVSHGAPGDAAAGNGELDATIAPLYGVAGALPQEADDVNRAISEDGATIVFSTAEALQQSDTNAGETPSCGLSYEPREEPTGCDVYVWHEGAVHMLSDGQSAPGADRGVGGIYGGSGGVASPGMSANGSNIFFSTATPLVGQDTDELPDVYDARIDGGFPAPTPEPSCTGEGCQGTPSTLPVFEAPSTIAFTGGKNLIPPPEPKPGSEETGRKGKKGHGHKGNKAQRRGCRAKFKHIKNNKRRHHKIARCRRRRHKHKGRASRHHGHHHHHRHRKRH